MRDRKDAYADQHDELIEQFVYKNDREPTPEERDSLYRQAMDLVDNLGYAELES